MTGVEIRQDAGGRLHLETVCAAVEVDGGCRVVLADGRGGMVSGRPVAELVAATLARGPAGGGSRDFASLHTEIVARNADPAARSGEWVAMTCSAAVVQLRGRRLSVAQVGDVRVYLLGAAGTLTLLTADQTLAALYGVPDAPVGAERAWARSVIVQHLGGAQPPTTNERDCDVTPGERILVTSGALPRNLPDALITEGLRAASSIEAADELLRRALHAVRARGETSNIALAVVDVHPGL